MKWAGRVGFVMAACALVCCGSQAQDQGPRVQLQIGAPQANQQRMLATVTGRVTCSDTQRAARFATVTLIGTDQANQTQGRGGYGFGFGRRVTARTDMDGNYTVMAEPGDYYVTASATGYASPVAETAARLRSGSTAADLLASLPQVHVAEGGGGTANITLDRGGVIQGKMQWDDGTPAAGVNVSVQSTAQSTAPATDLTRVVSQLGGGFGGGLGGFQTSDDRGVFRITGLAPGSYWVRATMMTPSAEEGSVQRVSSIVMYAPGKVRRSDAQVVTLKSGEERDDVQFVLDLSTLHTVSGHVGSTDQGNVAAGVVRLTDTQDSSLSRMAMIQPDGSFAVQWVPAGTYTLAVSNASSVASQSFGRRPQGESAGTSYAPFQESLTVTDSDVGGIGVTLSPASSQ
ncbi:MAG TPA: carboxypeptidase-like regulatory domain-containing protein [Acidobacteriaceae bacterium]|nr:carboxypeptidase-like regulatory domain-containing protein [Acidobacteriaceae bacterium]